MVEFRGNAPQINNQETETAVVAKCWDRCCFAKK